MWIPPSWWTAQLIILSVLLANHDRIWVYAATSDWTITTILVSFHDHRNESVHPLPVRTHWKCQTTAKFSPRLEPESCANSFGNFSNPVGPSFVNFRLPSYTYGNVYLSKTLVPIEILAGQPFEHRGNSSFQVKNLIDGVRTWARNFYVKIPGPYQYGYSRLWPLIWAAYQLVICSIIFVYLMDGSNTVIPLD